MRPPEPRPPERLCLEPAPGGLELRETGSPPGTGVRAVLRPVRRGRHPLARAVRGTSGPVVDATCGLGGDTAVLADLGRTVLAIERHPWLHRMLEEAHGGLEDRELAARIILRREDARALLPRLEAPYERPAAVILDPMYPVRRSSSALPPKPMQLLRALHESGEADDVEGLLVAAFASRARRIILKRPPEAPAPEGWGRPTFSIESKLVRWDVWDRAQSSLIP